MQAKQTEESPFFIGQRKSGTHVGMYGLNKFYTLTKTSKQKLSFPDQSSIAKRYLFNYQMI